MNTYRHEKRFICEGEQFLLSIQGYYLVHPIHSFNIEAQRVLASLALALLVFSLLKVATAVSSWDTVAPAELLEAATDSLSSSGTLLPQLLFALAELSAVFPASSTTFVD